MKRVIKATLTSHYKIGKFKVHEMNDVLEFIGFTFLPDDPDIAVMFDPEDKSAIDVYDDKSGDIIRYEGANIDGSGEAFLEAMKDDYDEYIKFSDKYNITEVPITFETLLFLSRHRPKRRLS